jgi:hypothetical protein
MFTVEKARLKLGASYPLHQPQAARAA